MLKEQKETVGLNTGNKGKGRPLNLGSSKLEEPKNNIPTLSEVGIDKKLSSRAQKKAAIPVEVFEKRLKEQRTKFL